MYLAQSSLKIEILSLFCDNRRQRRSSAPDGDPLADSQAQPQLSMFNLMFKSGQHRDIAKILRESTGNGQRRGKTMIKLAKDNLDILDDVETIDLAHQSSEVIFSFLLAQFNNNNLSGKCQSTSESGITFYKYHQFK